MLFRSRDHKASALEVELDVVRSLVRTYGYAAYGVEKLCAVDSQDVGVVLRDHVTIFRILSYHEAADHHSVAELEYGIL